MEKKTYRMKATKVCSNFSAVDLHGSLPNAQNQPFILIYEKETENIALFRNTP